MATEFWPAVAVPPLARCRLAGSRTREWPDRRISIIPPNVARIPPNAACLAARAPRGCRDGSGWLARWTQLLRIAGYDTCYILSSCVEATCSLPTRANPVLGGAATPRGSRGFLLGVAG